MNISNFVKELAETLTKKLFDMRMDDRRNIASRIIVSEDWEKSKKTIMTMDDFAEINELDGNKYLRLSGHFGKKKGLKELINFMYVLFFRAKQMSFRQLDFRAEVTVWWQKVEDFLKETDIADLSAIEVKSVFYSEDPTKPRIGPNQLTNSLEARLTRLPFGMKSLRITAQGDYASLLRKKDGGTVMVSLSTIDAERLLKASSGISRRLLKAALKPQKKKVCVLNPQSGMMEEQRVEEITLLLSTSRLPHYEEILGRKLDVNSQAGSKKSGIAEITKLFWRTSRALKAMKEIIARLDCLETSTVFGRPIITMPQVKSLLDKHMGWLEHIWITSQPLARDWSMFGGDRLAKIFGLDQAEKQFGKEVVDAMNKMDTAQYLQLLKDLGFVYEEDEEDEDIDSKLRYLFRFLLQSYRADSENLVTQYRELYVNKPPKTSIWGKVNLDASRLSRLRLPAQAKICGLRLEKTLDVNNPDELIIKNNLPFDGNDFSFWARIPISPDETQLLELQNYACEALGITVSGTIES